MNMRNMSPVLLFLFLSINAMQNTELFSEEEYRLYCTVRELADLIYKSGQQSKLPPGVSPYKNRGNGDDYRKKSVDPHMGIMQQGLILVREFDGVCSLLTPWGLFRFCRHPQRSLDLEKMSVAAQMFDGYSTRRASHEGQCYNIGSVDGEKLPTPKLLQDFDYPYRGGGAPKIRKKKWDAMTEKYINERTYVVRGDKLMQDGIPLSWLERSVKIG